MFSFLHLHTIYRFSRPIFVRLYFFIFLFVTFFVPSIVTAALQWPSIDSLLQNIYSKVRQGDAVDKIPETFQVGNIYQGVHKMIRDSGAKTTMDALSAAVIYLNQIHDCDLTPTNVGVILWQNKTIRPVLSSLIKMPSTDDISLFYDVFYASCMQLAGCQKLSKQASMTTEVLDMCIKQASEAYYLIQPSLTNIATMKQSTYGDNIFIDGKEENSPFDLMVDIDRIGQVLFKNHKARPEITFFEMPDIKPPFSVGSIDAGGDTAAGRDVLQGDIGLSPVTVTLRTKQRGPGTYTLVASAKSKSFDIVDYQFWIRQQVDSVSTYTDWSWVDTKGKPYIDPFIPTATTTVRVIATDEFGQTGEVSTEIEYTPVAQSSQSTSLNNGIGNDVQKLMDQAIPPVEQEANSLQHGVNLGNPCVLPVSGQQTIKVPPTLIIPTLQQTYTALLVQQNDRLRGGNQPMLLGEDMIDTSSSAKKDKKAKLRICGQGGQNPDVGVRLETRSLGGNSYEVTMRTTARSLLSGYTLYKDGQVFLSGTFPIIQIGTGLSGQTNGSITTTVLITSETSVEATVVVTGGIQGCASAILFYDENVCAQTCSIETDPRASELCTVNCCIKTCTDVYGKDVSADGIQGVLQKGSQESDKIICISKCLCGEIKGPTPGGKLDVALQSERSPQFEYRLTFCRVPVTVQSIIPKNVATIEEVLDEISIVIKSLKESGQLLKHVKTKEMFETSMQKIKFADMLAFNIFIKFKPVFTSIPETTLQANLDDKNKKVEKSMRGVGTMDITQERNKYLLLYNAPRQNATKEVATDYTMELNNLEAVSQKLAVGLNNTSAITKEIEEKAKAVYGDAFVGFVIQNTSFRHEVTETLMGMNDIATALKVKIEKAK